MAGSSSRRLSVPNVVQEAVCLVPPQAEGHGEPTGSATGVFEVIPGGLVPSDDSVPLLGPFLRALQQSSEADLRQWFQPTAGGRGGEKWAP